MTHTDGAARPDRLSITTDTVDDVRVVAARGEIDYSNRDRFAQALLPPGTTAPPRTVLDLTGVTFMDSTGLNALIAAHLAATRTEGWLRLVCPQGPVLRVIQLVGVDAAVGCHPTLHHALRA
ncbi:STAS domain-containing protein [Streptomyces minutiscleroticus]|uniref:Anti-sigma factor antagonist n=1 Tax=Streptomyces minutiscleroticus TaxID=68238 RepID=A0A918KGJ8_9ACTN|nr:STAS domain-containing protein [Streptomyces minutiscleroticus]GGX60030.1 anti-sigma-B factor antagonist [Streptomyces minutiscleroticus]